MVRCTVAPCDLECGYSIDEIAAWLQCHGVLVSEVSSSTADGTIVLLQGGQRRQAHTQPGRCQAAVIRHPGEYLRSLKQQHKVVHSYRMSCVVSMFV
jgi:hypothetical protein